MKELQTKDKVEALARLSEARAALDELAVLKSKMKHGLLRAAVGVFLNGTEALLAIIGACVRKGRVE